MTKRLVFLSFVWQNFNFNEVSLNLIHQQGRKIEIEGMLSAIFVIKTPRCDYCFVSLMKLTYMTFKWVSLSIFPWTGSNLNLEMKKSLNFNDFLWQTIFEIFQTRTKYTILDWISPSIAFFETFANNRPFICNHHQTNKK